MQLFIHAGKHEINLRHTPTHKIGPGANFEDNITFDINDFLGYSS